MRVVSHYKYNKFCMVMQNFWSVRKALHLCWGKVVKVGTANAHSIMKVDIGTRHCFARRGGRAKASPYALRRVGRTRAAARRGLL